MVSAGRRVAATFSADGGIERQVSELQCHVLAYPASARDSIVETVQAVIDERAHLAGPLTLDAFKPLIPRHVKKSKELAKILAEAERLTAEEILKRPDGRLLAKKANIQTFANEDRGLIIASMQRAIATVTSGGGGGGVQNLDGWMRLPGAQQR